MNATEVEVPIFLNPHLFWLFEKKNSTRRHQLQCDLAKEYEGVSPINQNFSVGEMVVVKKKQNWCRAIFEDYLGEGSLKYEVWLIDYGHLYHTNTLYKLGQQYKSQSAFIKQACLNNVVFTDEMLNLEDSCINKVKSSNPNNGAITCALQFFKDYTLFFSKTKEINGIYFGDILYKHNGKSSSLTETLIEKCLMVEDKALFTEVESTRIKDRHLHILALRQASRPHKDVCKELDLSVLMDQIFTRTGRGISLSDQCTESENDENIKPKTSNILEKLKRRHMMKNKTDSCNESELDECVDDKKIEEKSMNNVLTEVQSEPESKISKLAKLRNRIKNTSNIKTESKESPIQSDCSFSEIDEQLKSKSKLLALKLKCAKFKYTQKTSDTESCLSVDTLPSSTSKYSSCQNASEKDDSKVLKGLFLPGGMRDHSKSSKKTDKRVMKKNNVVKYSTDDSSNVSKVSSEKKEVKTDNCEIKTHKDEIKTDKDSSKNSDSEWSNSCKEGTDSGSQIKVQPVCSCNQCHHWTHSDNWSPAPEFFSGECKNKKIEIERPENIFFKGKRDDNIKIVSVNYGTMTKIQKQAAFKILVHGLVLPMPIERISEAPFHSLIHTSLQTLGYTRSKKVQSYIWPAICRYMNVCYIHKKKSGKSLAYLPPICSFVLEREERYDLKEKGGPIITILGSNSTQCEDIYYLFNKITGNVGYKIRPKVFLVLYPYQHINLSSVDVLITIPSILIELMKKNATNMKRLCHLVLEDIDILLDKYSIEIKIIMESIEKMLKIRNSKQSVQMIMSGEHWTLKLEAFVKKLRELPLISIGDYLEASMYGRMKLKLKCVESKEKLDVVVDILKSKWNFLRSIVLCNSNKEVNALKTTLTLSSISYIVITEDLSKEEMLQQEDNWKLATGGDYKVLICTDQVLHTRLSITTAAMIVHFSLPDKWTWFVERFHCFIENYKSPLVNNDNKIICESHVLIDETCDTQLPRLLSLLKNSSYALEQFEDVLKKCEKQKEISKAYTKTGLCKSLKQFGYCKTNNCSQRHVLNKDLDTNNSLPQNGSIKFKIVEMLDVNYFRISIIEHKNIEGDIIPFNFKTCIDNVQLTTILSEKRNNSTDICKGKSYAFWNTEEFDDLFMECIVEEIKFEKISILIKENGRRMLVSKKLIFDIPEELKKSFENDFDSSCTKLILAGVKPPYKDDQFCERAYHKLEQLINQLKFDDNLFSANICLQIDDTIWVNNVTEEVHVFDMDVYKTDITKVLLEQKLAEKNEEHLKSLYNLCEDANIVLPKYDIPVKKTKLNEINQITPQWAFLEVENCNAVLFSSAISPEEVYVRLEKFNSLLTNLEDDIAEDVIRQGTKCDIVIIAGKYYLAKDHEEDKFHRVLVKKIDGDQVLCFSVDYGYESVVSVNDIKILSNRLIQKLPFQAIQCKLHGLIPICDEWSIETVDVLYNKFIVEDGTDYFRTLYAKCMYYEKGSFRGQSKFSILLKDIYNKPIIINQLFVDCGWADKSPGIKLDDFEIIQDKDDSYMSDEYNESEEMKEIIEKTEIIDSNQAISNSDQYNGGSEIDFFFGESDQEQQFYEFMEALTKCSREKREAATTVSTHDYLPAITAAPFEADYLTPNVYWSQTINTLQLIIEIPNVTECKVKIVKSKIFVFETNVDEKKYGLNLLFFEDVEKDYKQNIGGLEVKISFNKKKELEWPRLTTNKKRLRNIHYMMNNDDMKGEKKLFLDLGEDLKVSKDEDGPMYTVVSDNDSEFEMDLEDSDS